MDQLTFDGDVVSLPSRPRHLTVRQRDLLRYMRIYAGIRTRDGRYFYADPTGALRRLEGLGLVERVARGRWRAT